MIYLYGGFPLLLESKKRNRYDVSTVVFCRGKKLMLDIM